MTYHFDEIMERRGTDSMKHDELTGAFGTADLIPLWVADMDFRTAQPVIDACMERARHGIYGYASMSPDFWQAAIDFQRRRHGWEITPGTISIAPGVMPTLAELVREFSAPGDSVLIQTPVLAEFYDVIECWGGRNVLENRLVQAPDGRWGIDFQDLEAKLRRGPKLFLISNPQNPTGRVWTREELERAGQLCVTYGVPMVADEIHADLTLFGNQYTPAGTLSEPVRANTICCFSTTKAFNLAGLQTNCVVFPRKDWQTRFERTWKNYEIERSTCFGVSAIRAAWQHGDEWLDQLCAYLSGNMTLLHDFLEREIPQIKMQMPEATYLAWLDCRALGLTGEALGRFFAEEAHVGLTSGDKFQRGLQGYMRLNVACPRSILQKALEQMRDAVCRRLSR